jgi:hypothetical protein
VKALVVACLFLSLLIPSVNADIIYFKDGMKTICQQKAWEEDGQIKCEYEGWVITYPIKDVSRIVKTNPTPNVTSSEKNHPVHLPAGDDGPTGESGRPPAGGIAFYNPRRPYKYWTDKNTKHKNYKEAIRALAEKYDRSPEWIQAHMGTTNDLGQIHRNLAGSISDRKTAIASPPVPKMPGIAFYNPRRTFPYWTGKDSKHKSYQEAIRTLAEKYGKSTDWVRKNMGNSNDLNEIHKNLKNAK